MTRKSKKTHEARQLLPTYPSMQACASGAHVPKLIQQEAKRGGCTAFDQAGRVHLGPLLQWIFSKDADGEGLADWPGRLKRAQALKAEHELEIAKGEVVRRSDVRSDMTRAAAKAVSVLTQKFETELPPKQDGMPAADIAAMNRTALHEVRTILSQPGAYAD